MQETFRGGISADLPADRGLRQSTDDARRPVLQLLSGPQLDRPRYTAHAHGALLDRALLLPAAQMACHSLAHEGFREAEPLQQALAILAELQHKPSTVQDLCRVELVLQRAVGTARPGTAKEVTDALQHGVAHLKEAATHTLRHLLLPDNDRLDAAFESWRSGAASVIAAWRCYGAAPGLGGQQELPQAPEASGFTSVKLHRSERTAQRPAAERRTPRWFPLQAI